MVRLYNILLGLMWSLIYTVIGIVAIAGIERRQETLKVRDFNADMAILAIAGFGCLLTLRVLWRGLRGRIRPTAA